jgi:hypothetical protein
VEDIALVLGVLAVFGSVGLECVVWKQWLWQEEETEIVQGREDCGGCATNGCLPTEQLARECDLFETSP